MHCSNFCIHSLWSGFVSNSPVKLNVTALPGSESRGRKGGEVCEGGDDEGNKECVTVQEGSRLCVFVVKTVIWC